MIANRNIDVTDSSSIIKSSCDSLKVSKVGILAFILSHTSVRDHKSVNNVVASRALCAGGKTLSIIGAGSAEVNIKSGCSCEVSLSVASSELGVDSLLAKRGDSSVPDAVSRNIKDLIDCTIGVSSVSDYHAEGIISIAYWN